MAAECREVPYCAAKCRRCRVILSGGVGRDVVAQQVRLSLELCKFIALQRMVTLAISTPFLCNSSGVLELLHIVKMSRKRNASVLEEHPATATELLAAFVPPLMLSANVPPLPSASNTANNSVPSSSGTADASSVAQLPSLENASVAAHASSVALAMSTVPANAPVREAAGDGAPPASPGRNRQLFLTAMTPQHMTCDLTNAVVGMGVKHNIECIIIAIFPVQNGPPARRHILVRDQFGTTGITVWHADVHKFPKQVLGAVVSITRASVSLYQGKKNLVLNKESTVIVNATMPSPLTAWWASLADASPLPLPAAMTAAENSIINVFGILGFCTQDTKEVNGVLRQVTSIHLVSPTAKLQLRGWDLETDTFSRILSMQDKVVKVLRIRITCYAELKIGEILDSALGTSFNLHSDPELELFWAN